jgi:hypothetical protein
MPRMTINFKELAMIRSVRAALKMESGTSALTSKLPI